MSRFMERPAGLGRQAATVVLTALALVLISPTWLQASPGGKARPKRTQGGVNEPPVISGCFATPNSLPANGGIATVICHVTDDGTIDSVSVQASGSNGQVIGGSLSHTSGDTYEGQLSFPPNLTNEPVSYGLEWFALDTAGGSSATGLIVNVDVDGQPQFDEFPVVSDVLLEPARHTAAGGNTTISANVTDDRSVAEARALVIPPGGGEETVVVLKSNGSRYVGVFPVPANTTESAQEYTVTVLATDDIGQEGQAAGGVITVDANDEDPVLTKPSVTPRKLKASGKGLAVSVVATDDHEVVSVVARFVRGKQVVEVELQKAAKGDTYSAAATLPRNRSARPQVYRVEFVAIDSFGNTATLEAGSVKVKTGKVVNVVLRPHR